MKSLSWRQRDEEIARRATRHVCRTRHFFDLFSSEQAAYRRIDKLRKRGLLRQVGELMVKDLGRPEKVYCNGWKPKWDQVRHECLLTDFFLMGYPEADCLRGWLVNKRIRPDAEMTLHGVFFYVELDTGSESLAQVRKRQAAYAGVEDSLLYVTLSKRRCENLRKASKAVASIALFTTLNEALENPRGAIWRDATGEDVSILPKVEG
jgi:hypothetical protein